MCIEVLRAFLGPGAARNEIFGQITRAEHAPNEDILRSRLEIYFGHWPKTPGYLPASSEVRRNVRLRGALRYCPDAQTNRCD